MGTEVTAALFDRIGELIIAVQNGYAAEPIRKGPKPYPRPITGIDLAKEQADEQADRSLNDLIAQAQQTYREQHREG